MEQKKTLWIIAAVGVFLLVVLGFALIVSSGTPTGFEATTTTIPTVENKDYSNGWSSPSDVPPALAEEEITDSDVQSVNDVVIVSNNTTVFDLNQNGTSTTIDLNTLKSQSIYDTQDVQNTAEQASSSEVKVTKNETVSNEATEYYVGPKQNASQAEKTEKAASVKRTEPAAVKTSSATVKTTKPAATTSTKTTATKTASTSTAKAATTAPQAKPVTRFWVQVASYTNKKTAENARAILSDNKISSDIYTYQDNSSKLFYRVRVGPFTTKSEAEYWMSKITQIKDFSKAGSYVTSTTDK